MTLEDLRLRCTQQLVEEVDARMPLVDQSVTLVLVERPATRQRILAIRRLDVAADQSEYEDGLSDLLYDEMQRLGVPPRDPDRPTIVVTLIARRGFNVCTRIEGIWMMAWRYSNHLTGAFVGDTVVVTEHGWASLDTHAAGEQPSISAASARTTSVLR